MSATPPPHGVGTYAAALVRSHAEHADRPAMALDDGSALLYREVWDRAARIAAGMAERGLRSGDRVVIALDNDPAGLLLERAVMLWGLVRVAVSARLHPEEISWIADDCDAALVAVEDRHADRLSPAVRNRAVVRRRDPAARWHELERDCSETPSYDGVRADDPAALMYTSGTTGRPKGAVSTQRAWMSMAAAVGELLGARPDDVLTHVAPFSHFSGSVASGYAVAGAQIVALPRASYADLPDQLRAAGATCVPLVPTMLGDLVAAHPGAPLDLPDLRVVPYGGSTVSPIVLARARATLGGVLSQFYGASEALVPVLHLSGAEHSGLSSDVPVPAGHPGPGIEVALDALTAGSGPSPSTAGEARGELLVRGDRVMSGYWGRPGPTAAVLDGDGWYRTGDLAHRDSDGRYTIVGRRGDVIITGGFNVYPAEVERVVAEVPGVKEVSVVKCSHPRWGEGVAAVIATTGVTTVTEADVIEACRAHLADYKKPVRICFVPHLPRLSTGKIDTQAVEHLVNG